MDILKDIAIAVIPALVIVLLDYFIERSKSKHNNLLSAVLGVIRKETKNKLKVK